VRCDLDCVESAVIFQSTNQPFRFCLTGLLTEGFITGAGFLSPNQAVLKHRWERGYHTYNYMH